MKNRTINDLVKLLKQRLKKTTTYKVVPDGFCSDLEQEYENLQIRAHDSARVRPTFDVDLRHLSYSDMAIAGTGGQVELASRLGLILPQDYVEFCEEFQEYVLATRNPIWIEGVEAIEDTMQGLRDAIDIPKDKPHRLFYFASVAGTSSNYVFRWSENMKRMDIVFAEDYGVVLEPQLLAAKRGKYVTDKTFTDWLNRMIDTDCYPLVPGRNEPDNSSLTRIE